MTVTWIGTSYFGSLLLLFEMFADLILQTGYVHQAILALMVQPSVAWKSRQCYAILPCFLLYYTVVGRTSLEAMTCSWSSQSQESWPKWASTYEFPICSTQLQRQTMNCLQFSLFATFFSDHEYALDFCQMSFPHLLIRPYDFSLLAYGSDRIC